MSEGLLSVTPGLAIAEAGHAADDTSQETENGSD